ncbi:MAG: zinc ribbon domain-containing protein [Planctomycetota bacterium]|nr:MAG: zinc ribbon domain-containing protein [Planctomycetota bacterium]
MIPCQECGHINRLGAIYCGSCGAKLTVDVSHIESAIRSTAAEARGEKVFKAGTSAISICGFLFIAAAVLQFVVMPPMPSPVLPMGTPGAAEEIMNAEAEWLRPRLDLLPGIDERGFDSEGSLKLLAWRRQHRDLLLAGIDQEQIRNWQIEVFNSRQRDGSWRGGDSVAATGMALLALMARPDVADFDVAIDAGVEYLKPRILAGSSGRDPIAHTIGIMALVESGQLSERENASIRPSLYRGDAPQWQSLALLSFHPDQRPRRIAAIQSNINESVWRHYLQFLSRQRVLDEVNEDLFAEGAGEAFSGIDRLAWTLTSLWMGRNPQALQEQLAAWSQLEMLPVVERDLRELIGDHAGLSLAILNATASLRAPPSWVRPPSE